jgi:peptidoglycan DL-endopeptidase CwlO
VTDQLASAQGREAAAFAHSQDGKPYQFGATGPDAYDCSGLTQASYRHAGVTIPRTSEGQWATSYPKVKWGSWAPGDLVFSDFNDGQPSPGHVVIYLGAGKCVSAPHTGTVVQVVPVADFRSHYVGSNRPVPLVAQTWDVRDGAGEHLGTTHHPVRWALRHPRSFRTHGVVSFHRRTT